VPEDDHERYVQDGHTELDGAQHARVNDVPCGTHDEEVAQAAIEDDLRSHPRVGTSKKTANGAWPSVKLLRRAASWLGCLCCPATKTIIAAGQLAQACPGGQGPAGRSGQVRSQPRSLGDTHRQWLGCFGVEVVALVVHHDERREVLDVNLPDCLHAKLRVFQDRDGLDAVLGQPGGRATDGAEIKSPFSLHAAVTAPDLLPLASMIIEPPAAWNCST